MENAQTHDLVLDLILYVILPLWGISGFVDWVCHRVTKIEHTSGLKESVIHAIMGIQIGIPIVVGITFQMNVLVFLICLAALVAHEIVAHHDVAYTMDKRKISIWEVHAHNYLATIPFYLIALIAVRNPATLVKTFTLDWAGQLELIPYAEPVGGAGYLPWYLTFMGVICIIPYTEELVRCLLARARQVGA